MLEGARKFWIVIIGIFVELGGLLLAVFNQVDLGVFTAFSGAIVALCGLFFGANIKEHKVK